MTPTIRFGTFAQTVIDGMVARAEFYRWKAARRQPLAGNDPITGKRRGVPLHSRSPFDEAAWIAAHKAMARSYLDSARQYRAATAAMRASR